MALRAYWTGTLRLSLVTVPVRLYPAVDSGHRVALHQIHEPTGERVRYQKVVPHQGPVDEDEIVKGYEYEHGRYVTLTDEELDHLKLESVHRIDLLQFVEAGEIDPIYYHRPYFLAPDGAAADEAFRLIREALRQSRTVGLGQVVLGGRERIVALRPCGRGLLLEALRYEDEVREASTYFRHIADEPVDQDQLALAVKLIETRTAPFDPAAFQDRYQDALRDLVAAKIEDREPEMLEPEPAGDNIVDLMEALRRSLSEGRGRKARAAERAGRGRIRAKPGGRSGARRRSA
ncbi:Ku protein [Rhodospirillaceae bacterium SYSU D60014]|uniref:non-homologous end joining protein Ku n=1 Tax=Virgifigura deserti TaxID=2268457 RepID=UPI000E662187